MPTLPTAAPRWVVDPDFNLDFHVRRVRVPEPGTLREVFDLAEVAAAVAAGHLPAAVDGDPGRGSRRRPGRDDAAPQPRRHRRRRRRRDVRQHLRPRARPAAAGRAAAADPAGPVAQRPDARRASTGCPARSSGGVRGALSGAAHGGRASGPRPGVDGRRRRRLRHVGCPGDRTGRRAVAAAAAAQPGVAQRGDRHRVRRPAQGRQGGGRLDQRRLPGRTVRRAAALPRGHGRADRHAADGGAGQPAVRRRSRRRQPIRRRQSGGADRPASTPTTRIKKHPLADDPASATSAR